MFCGQYIQESAKTKSKTVAKEAEKNRRGELEEGYKNITPEDRNRRILTLEKAAEEYQKHYEMRNSPNAARYSEYCIKHLGGSCQQSCVGVSHRVPSKRDSNIAFS